MEHAKRKRLKSILILTNLSNGVFTFLHHKLNDEYWSYNKKHPLYLKYLTQSGNDEVVIIIKEAFLRHSRSEN